MQLVYSDNPGSAPATYPLPSGLALTLESVYAEWNGTGAATAFVPCLTLLSQDNKVIGRWFPGPTIQAGDTTAVTYSPLANGAGDGIQFDVANEGDWLYVKTDGSGGPAAASITLDAFEDLELDAGRDVNVNQYGGRDWNQYSGNDINLTSGGDYNLVSLNDINEFATRDLNLAGSNSASIVATTRHARLDFSSGGDNAIQFRTGDTFKFWNNGIFFGEQALLALFDQSATDVIVVVLRSGKRLLVQDESGNGLFRIDDNGDLHGQTGKALTFDL